MHISSSSLAHFTAQAVTFAHPRGSQLCFLQNPRLHQQHKSQQLQKQQEGPLKQGQPSMRTRCRLWVAIRCQVRAE